MTVCYFLARKYKIPALSRANVRDFIRSVNRGKWALFAPILILGGIYGGIFTPTEASMVAIAYGLVVGLFIYKGLTFKGLGPLVLKSMKTTSIVMFIIAVASLFGWLLAYEQVPDKIVGGLMTFSDNKYLILLVLNVVLIILGAFMDNLAAMIILGGLLIKLGLTLGIDPVQLGAIVVVNFAVGMETPPFGYSLFIGSAISGLSIEEISKGMFPFFLVDLAMLALVTYVPWATLWLGMLIFG